MGVGDGWELPEGTEPWSDFHWFQSSTKGDLDLVILSLNPAWYTGHFVGNRMVPCSGSGCELCSTGIGGQVRYVFAVAEHSSKRVGFIEFGRSNGLLCRELAERAGGLRGLRICVRKHSKNVQSRTEIQYIETPCESWYLSLKVPDPCLALYLTWHKVGFKMPASFESRMSEQVLKDRSMSTGMTLAEKMIEAARIANKTKSRG